jgi:hypothetical protein
MTSSANGSADDIAAMVTSVEEMLEKNTQDTVSKKVFRWCPFVCSDEEMQWNSGFANLTMTFMDIGKGESGDIREEKRKEFWAMFGEKARKNLNSKRSTITTNIKARFKGEQQTHRGHFFSIDMSNAV